MTTYSKIILTKSSAALARPNSDDLDFGELAINYGDGKLYFKDASSNIKVMGSSESILTFEEHIQNEGGNPHNVTAANVGLGNVDNTSDALKIISDATQAALDDKADLETTYTKDNIDTLLVDKITLADISMGPVAAASGFGSVTYDDETGRFTYSPPTLASLGGIRPIDISVSVTTAPGSLGNLSTDGDGVLNYTRPTLAGLGGIGFSNLSVTTALASGNGAVSYNSSNGEFTYTPPALIDLGGITLSSFTVGAEGTPAGVGSLTYDNTSGTFTYTPPTLAGLGYGTIATQDSDDVSITGGAILASGGAELTGGGVLGYKSVSPGHYVTQGTDFETAVTINSVAGTINCVANSTYNGNTLHPFIVNNTEVAATDVVVVSIQSETGASNVLSAAVTETTSGSFTISVINTSNSNVDATVILNFAIIKHINPIAV